MSKVICIGFHKTGTTSMGNALSLLGYSVVGSRRGLTDACRNGRWPEIFSVMDRFDACQDNPWAVIYPQLDRHYPGSRFIMTYRDPEEWLASVCNHFRKRPSPMRKWIYGEAYPVGNETIYLQRYQRHLDDVRAYFSQRPDDYLELRLGDSQIWEKMCPFLGHPVPNQPFPHLNKRR